jgi:CHAD domain-containing protein
MKPQNISAYARDQARSRLQRFLAEEKRAGKHLDNPESIHDLRVSIRRFTQCLRTFRGLFAPGPAKKIRRRLRKLMDLCSAVRNCDVALELLRQAGVHGGPSVPHLGALRQEAGQTLGGHLEGSPRWKKSKWLKGLRLDVREDSEWAPGQSVEENLARILPALAEDLFAAGQAAAAAGATHDTVHQFRLRAKRFRYALELFPSFYGDPMQDHLQALGELQDRLGAINDCVTTIAMLPEDRRAAVAVGKLLRQREMEFRRHWKAHYSGGTLAVCKSWLGHPLVVTK